METLWRQEHRRVADSVAGFENRTGLLSQVVHKIKHKITYNRSKIEPMKIFFLQTIQDVQHEKLKAVVISTFDAIIWVVGETHSKAFYIMPVQTHKISLCSRGKQEYV